MSELVEFTDDTDTKYLINMDSVTHISKAASAWKEGKPVYKDDDPTGIHMIGGHYIQMYMPYDKIVRIFEKHIRKDTP